MAQSANLSARLQRRKSSVLTRASLRQSPHKADFAETLECRLIFSATFAAAANQPVGDGVDFVESVDLNGDGNRDLVLSSYESGGLKILLGNGDSTFQTPTQVILANAPDHVAAADLNGDSRIDLITTSYENDSIGVLLGNGDGSFLPVANYAAGTGPRMVAVGDFTGDGRPDLAVGKSFGTTLTILRNNGNGTFQSPINTTVAFRPVDLVTGDFNGDGKIDLAAADFVANRVALMLGQGNATFQTATTYTTGSGPASIAAGDFNADGKLDVVTANFFGDNVSLLLGNGNGSLQAAANFASGNGATFVVPSDLDGDGTLDLAVANADADTVSVLFNTAGSFASPASYAVGDSPRSLAVANFNGSGLDLAVANQNSANVSILLGSGVVPPPTASAGGPYTVSEGSTVQLSALGSSGVGITCEWDLDNDGIYGETGTAAKRGNEVGFTPTFSAVGIDGPDSRPVRVRVTSSLGSSATALANVTIQNVAPTLTISGSSSAVEGSPYTLSLAASDPGPDTITSWTINWGNGVVQVVSGNPSSVTRAFPDNGTFTITATATDEDGTHSANTRTVSVSNVIPTLAIAGAANATLGQPYVLNLSSADPGTDTIVRWTISWGNGSTTVVDGNPSSATHTYSTSGTFTVTATATDEDGTFSAGSRTVTASAAPVAIAGTVYNTAEGGSVALSSASSTGSALTFAWDLDGDNVFGETGIAASRGVETGANVTFSAVGLDGPDTHTVRLRVTDALNRTSTASASVVVANVAPTVAIVGNGGMVAGDTYTLFLSASDPGPDTISSWMIDWGDGTLVTTDATPPSLSRTFDIAGTYTLSAAVVDEDGTYSTNSITLVVSPIPDVTPPSAVLSPLGTTSSAGGSSRWFSVTYDDNIAVDLATIDSSDILVSGPGGFQQSAAYISLADGSGAARVATYRFAAPGGSWDWSDNGSYTFSLNTAQVADPSGNFIPADVLGLMVVAIAPPDSAGNDFATARTLSGLSGGTVRIATDIVGPLDRNDFYRVNVNSTLDVSIKLSELTDRADLWLYDANGNDITSSRRGGTSDELILRTLQSGTYFVRVAYVGTVSHTDYRLRLGASVPPVDPGIASAINRGTLGTGAVSAVSGELTSADPFDYYRFALAAPATVYLKLSELADNADLQLLDSAGQVIATSARGGTSDDTIRLTLQAGTYHVRVFLSGTLGTTYRLRLANETPA